ncbi:MAG: DUF4293 domain-containing protein [Chlorobi bacterium]|nr:DUF4293 domain-containing protein [Chlorobiota bacterium]
MLQRIQSVYLFLSAVFLGLMFSFPYVSFLGRDIQIYTLGPAGLVRFTDGERLMDIYPVLILLLLTLLISVISIFLYKNRVRQMRYSVFNMLLMLGLLILIGYYIFYAKNQLDARMIFKVPLIFPLLSILFTYLAFRNIRKDEILIKSVDRIR